MQDTLPAISKKRQKAAPQVFTGRMHTGIFAATAEEEGEGR